MKKKVFNFFFLLQYTVASEFFLGRRTVLNAAFLSVEILGVFGDFESLKFMSVKHE